MDCIGRPPREANKMRVSASELVTAYDSTHSDSKIPGNEGNAYFVHFYQLWDRIEEVIDRVKVQYALRICAPTPLPPPPTAWLKSGTAPTRWVRKRARGGHRYMTPPTRRASAPLPPE